MLLFAAALALGFTQNSLPGNKITFSSNGLPVPRLVEQISKASHIELFAPKAFGTDVLCVRVQDVPLRDLLDRIGDLTAADWEKRGDRYELVRSAKKLTAEEKTVFERETAEYRAQIDQARERLSKMDALNDRSARTLAASIRDALANFRPGDVKVSKEQWLRGHDLDAQAPDGRAMLRVLAGMDAKELARLPSGVTTVYSNRPNRLQRPLPAASAEAAEMLAADQNVWADAAKAVFTSRVAGPTFSSAVEDLLPFENGVGKLRYSIYKSDSLPRMVEYQLKATDGDGVQRIQASSYVTFGSDEPEPKADRDEKPLARSKFVAAVIESKLFSPSKNDTTLPKDLRQVLLDPAQNEPLSLGTGEMLIQLAQAKGRNLIASLPDDSFFLGPKVETDRDAPSAALAIAPLYGLLGEEHGGWISLHPVNPIRARAERIDRERLAAFLQDCVNKGSVGLEPLAAMAASTPTNFQSTFGFLLAGALVPQQGTQFYDASTLRLYGLMTTDQRRQAESGGVPLSSLSPDEKKELDRIIFGQEARLDLSPKANLDTEEMRQYVNAGIAGEPTELLGSGIPPDSRLTLNEESGTILMSQPWTSPDGTIVFGKRPMTPKDLAERLYAKERPGVLPWYDKDPAVETQQFQIGSQRKLTLKFEFGSLAEREISLSDLACSAEKLSYGQIPDQFKQQIADALVVARKSYANLKPAEGQLGKSVPPPADR